MFCLLLHKFPVFSPLGCRYEIRAWRITTRVSWICNVCFNFACFFVSVHLTPKLYRSVESIDLPPNHEHDVSFPHKMVNNKQFKPSKTHRIHVWYIYLHLVDLLNVGKYTIHGSYGKENLSFKKPCREHWQKRVHAAMPRSWLHWEWKPFCSNSSAAWISHEM